MINQLNKIEPREMMTYKTKNKIDSMDYQSMLELWRFAEIGHPYFTGEIGDYFSQSMSLKKRELELVKVPVSQCIQEVLDYIQYSEMEGKVDLTDSWYTTYQSLQELQEKVLDEEEMS